MIIGGLGIAALPGWTAAPQISSGALVGVPLQPPGYRWQWSVAQLRGAPSPAYVEEFIRLISAAPLLTDFFPRACQVPAIRATFSTKNKNGRSVTPAPAIPSQNKRPTAKAARSRFTRTTRRSQAALPGPR
jgi:hypothetical protein